MRRRLRGRLRRRVRRRLCPAAEAAQADASLNAALDAEEEVAAREERDRDRHEWHLQIRMAPARLRGGTEWMWAEERKRAQRAREAGV